MRGSRITIGGLARVSLGTVAGLVLGIGLYIALVQLDIVRSPLDPSLRGDVELARGDSPGLRVLFVGNSFTFRNSMPALVHGLAAADKGARPIFSVQYTAPSWRLKRAAEDDGLVDVLRQVDWDVVVLQEASRIPSFPSSVHYREMYPYASQLVAMVRERGARAVLFMTWGYENGDSRNVERDTFSAMQARLSEGYAEEGRALSVPVVPVGIAWEVALRGRPSLDLWAGDGRHPSRLGSYLTACVFYAALTDRDPSRSDFTNGLAFTDARYLQRVASDVVR